MDLGFDGSAVAIAGGSKGMGRAVAECLAPEGARVALLARGREALAETAAVCRANGSPDVAELSVRGPAARPREGGPRPRRSL